MQIPMRKTTLVLEDGTFFEGRAVSAGEARFTTATAGCEEAVTDPSQVTSDSENTAEARSRALRAAA